MKLKDYVFDPDRGLATIWLEEVLPVQLENILMILRDEPETNLNSVNYDSLIFGDNE